MNSLLESSPRTAPASLQALVTATGFAISAAEKKAVAALLARVDALSTLRAENPPGSEHKLAKKAQADFAASPSPENLAQLEAAARNHGGEAARARRQGAREAQRRMGGEVVIVVLPIMERFRAGLETLAAKTEAAEIGECERLEIFYEPSIALRAVRARLAGVGESLKLMRSAPELVPQNLRSVLAGLI